jgi:hypothetical protein
MKSPISDKTISWCESFKFPRTRATYDIGYECKNMDGILLFSVKGADRIKVGKVRVHQMLQGLTGGHPRPQGSLCRIFRQRGSIDDDEYDAGPVLKKIVVYQALVHAVKSISKINYDSPPRRLTTAKKKLTSLLSVISCVRDHYRYIIFLSQSLSFIITLTLLLNKK